MSNNPSNLDADLVDRSASLAITKKLSAYIRMEPFTLLAFGWVGFLIVISIFPHFLTEYDPNASQVSNRLQGISPEHLLGTDDLGRDLLSRVLWGARVALFAAGESVGIGLVIGVPFGLFIAYRGGWWDRLAMRIVEVEQAVPMLLFAFTFLAIFGRGLQYAMLAVGLAFAMSFTRLARGIALAESPKEYVQAAKIQGYGAFRIIFRHILPNVISPIAVQASILAGVAILIEAMLSFLGLGTPPGTPSWGAMLDEARRYQIEQPLLSIAPGAAITLTILAFNFIGDGLRNNNGRRLHKYKARIVNRVAYRAERTSSTRFNTPINAEIPLRITDLSVGYPGSQGELHTVLRNISITVQRGEIFGLVGESGSGKSMTASAIFGQIPPPGFLLGGSILLRGREIVGTPEDGLAKLRGKDVAIIFQDPIATFSPVHRIGNQLIDGLMSHTGISRREARSRVIKLFELVNIPNASERFDDYPHQFSGGMAQRAAIAGALLCRPALLIADEPTTALDVTVQKQVLELLLKLRDEFGMSIIFITHDLAIVAEICDRVGVMKNGEIVEEGKTSDIFSNPKHLYTQELIASRKNLSTPVV